MGIFRSHADGKRPQTVFSSHAQWLGVQDPLHEILHLCQVCVCKCSKKVVRKRPQTVFSSHAQWLVVQDPLHEILHLCQVCVCKCSKKMVRKRLRPPLRG